MKREAWPLATTVACGVCVDSSPIPLVHTAVCAELFEKLLVLQSNHYIPHASPRCALGGFSLPTSSSSDRSVLSLIELRQHLARILDQVEQAACPAGPPRWVVTLSKRGSRGELVVEIDRQ